MLAKEMLGRMLGPQWPSAFSTHRSIHEACMMQFLSPSLGLLQVWA